jgi:hypothetical protein
MDIQTATLDRKSVNKFTDIVTLGLYSVGIGAGAVAGLMALLLAA